MAVQAYSIEMEIAGSTAMWTRPDTGDSPVSYPAPTYSAVKAIFESVLWGPAVEIIPTHVGLCRPIQYHTYYTNYNGPLRSSADIKKGTPYQLRATVLIDVCYKLFAKVIPYPHKCKLPARAQEWDQKTKSPGHAYQSIFYRRLQRGQVFATPVLGWREFTPSYFGKVRDDTAIITTMQTIEIPSMLRQVFSQGYCSSVSYVYDTNLKIEHGVLHYPLRETQHD